MLDDPIVAEVRKARETIAKRYNHDLRAMVRDMQKRQKTSGHKIVSFLPKRVKTVTSKR